MNFEQNEVIEISSDSDEDNYQLSKVRLRRMAQIIGEKYFNSKRNVWSKASSTVSSISNDTLEDVDERESTKSEVQKRVLELTSDPDKKRLKLQSIQEQPSCEPTPERLTHEPNWSRLTGTSNQEFIQDLLYPKQKSTVEPTEVQQPEQSNHESFYKRTTHELIQERLLQETNLQQTTGTSTEYQLIQELIQSKSCEPVQDPSTCVRTQVQHAQVPIHEEQVSVSVNLML